MALSRSPLLFSLALTLALFVALAQAQPPPSIQPSYFATWCAWAGRSYNCNNPPPDRLNNWNDARNMINMINSGGYGFVLNIHSQQADTQQILLPGYGGVDKDWCNLFNWRNASVEERQVVPPSSTPHPNCIPQVRDIGNCATCYIPPILGAIEMNQCKKNGNVASPLLSIQHMLDCTLNSGCDGGNHFKVLMDLLFNSNFIHLNTNYPYTMAKNPSCLTIPKSPVPTGITGFQKLSDEPMLLSYVYNYGSALITWNIDQYFVFYKNGAYNGGPTVLANGLPRRLCSSNNNINHVLLVTGYESQVLHATNSWGTLWGDNGRVLLARVAHLCNMYVGAAGLQF